jgi:hypothetical protein
VGLSVGGDVADEAAAFYRGDGQSRTIDRNARSGVAQQVGEQHNESEDHHENDDAERAMTLPGARGFDHAILTCRVAQHDGFLG